MANSVGSGGVHIQYYNGTELLYVSDHSWASDTLFESSYENVTRVTILFNTHSTINFREIGIFTQDPTMPDPEPEQPEPEQPPVEGDRALLKISLETGLTKEYDVSLSEAQAFTNWINNRLNGDGPAVYTFENVLDGPFTKRTDHIIYNKVVFYEINEYTK